MAGQEAVSIRTADARIAFCMVGLNGACGQNLKKSRFAMVASSR
jgi:hypothetical protein